MIPKTREDIKEVILPEIKQRVQLFLERVIFPRMERQIEGDMERRLEEILEKKINERFAFAIELLRSLNEKKP